MEIGKINRAYPAEQTGTVNTPKKSGDFSRIYRESGSNTYDLDWIFDTASEIYGVPAGLLRAVAEAESNMNPRAVSPSGAQGIMQLMPSMAEHLGVTDSFNPEQSIMGGARYLHRLLNKFDSNLSLALAAYNAGSGTVFKYGGIPPFEETRSFVSNVLAKYEDPGNDKCVLSDTEMPIDSIKLRQQLSAYRFSFSEGANLKDSPTAGVRPNLPEASNIDSGDSGK